jgi:hypothetical protein
VRPKKTQAASSGIHVAHNGAAHSRQRFATNATRTWQKVQAACRKVGKPIPKQKLMMPSLNSILNLRSVLGGKPSALLSVKSALKQDGRRVGRRSKSVRFKGVVNPTVHALCTFLVEHCRSGSRTAVLWEAMCACLITVDFFLIPLSLVVLSLHHAHEVTNDLRGDSHVKEGTLSAEHLMFYITLALDMMFVMNAAFTMAQAMAWDLGFKDMPVDKIVDSAPGVVRKQPIQASSTAHEALNALNVGLRSWSGSQMQHTLYYDVSAQLLCMTPLWFAFMLQLSPLVQSWTHLLRLVRMRILLNFFSARQEDMAADVRWVAGCKFLMIIFSGSHWLGCIFFYLAAQSVFSQTPFEENWVTAWVHQSFVHFDWETSGPVFTYAVCLSHPRRRTDHPFKHVSYHDAQIYANSITSCVQCISFKGFSALTNMGYEDEVPMRYDEMVMSLVAQNAKVVLDAYILGTLFHYLVKKDPEVEAAKALMSALDVYCHERSLPSSLHEKMRDYLRFQQQHSTAAADHVIKVQTKPVQQNVHCVK